MAYRENYIIYMLGNLLLTNLCLHFTGDLFINEFKSFR